jgi:integrase/recombinase XerD
MNEIMQFEPKDLTNFENLDLSLLVKKFGVYLANQEKSDSTIKTYLFRLNKFFEYLGDHAWYLITPNDVSGYKEFLKTEKEYSPQSVNLHLTSARAFYRFLVENNILLSNPFSEIKGLKRNNTKTHKRNIITQTEFEALIKTCDNHSESDIRDKAILHLAYYLGCRNVEIIRADLEDIQTKGQYKVIWLMGKGHNEKDEYMIIPPKVEKVINEWLAIRGDKPGQLFWSLSRRSFHQRLSNTANRQMFNARKKLAGITDNKKTFHSLRHSAINNVARYAIEHNKSPYQVQSFARHNSHTTTNIYIHEIEREKDPPELWSNEDE